MTIRAMGEVESGMATRRRTSQSVLPASLKTGSRVLVVEDEQDVAELLRYNLSKEGYEVILVGNGADALKRAREAKPARQRGLGLQRRLADAEVDLGQPAQAFQGGK